MPMSTRRLSPQKLVQNSTEVLSHLVCAVAVSGQQNAERSDGGVKLIGRWVFFFFGGVESPERTALGALTRVLGLAWMELEGYGRCNSPPRHPWLREAAARCCAASAAGGSCSGFLVVVVVAAGLVPFWPGLVQIVDLSDCHDCSLIAGLLRAVAAVAQSVLGEACCGFMSAKGSESNVMGGPSEPDTLGTYLQRGASRPAGDSVTRYIT